MSLLGKDVEDAAKQLTETLHTAQLAIIDVRATLINLNATIARVNGILDKVAATLNATLK